MKVKFFLSVLFILSYCSLPQNQNKKPKNIILMIGDGMGIAHITAGIYSSPTPLNFTRFKSIGLMTTHSYDNIVTDSAASATAIATGEKSYNKAISVNPEKIPIKTILEIAKEKGFSIGVVVTNSVTDATPAAFLAHSESRKNHYEIAEDIVDLEPDILLGGGKDYFMNRRDGQNLLKKLKEKNYEIYLDFSEFQKSILETTDKKIIGLFADKNLPPLIRVTLNPNFIKDHKDLVENTDFSSVRKPEYLKLATRKAIEFLENKGKPFLLVIEGSQIDFGGHNMDGKYVINEVLDFDKTIGIALDFAERSKNTLVIATADHETGGLAITGGDLKNNQIEAKFIYGKHSASLVAVFTYGIGSEEFTGIYDNTNIFKKVKKLMQ